MQPTYSANGSLKNIIQLQTGYLRKNFSVYQTEKNRNMMQLQGGKPLMYGDKNTMRQRMEKPER